MKLSKFLQGVRACPDNALAESYGLHDNWTILVDQDPVKMRELLLETGKFRVHQRENNTSYALWLKEENLLIKESLETSLDYTFNTSPDTSPRLEYIPGTVVALIRKHTSPSIVSPYVYADNDPQVHIAKQWNERYGTQYLSEVSLHRCQIRKARGEAHRVIAKVNQELCTLLQKRGARFFLPGSMGSSFDISRAVFSPDLEEEKE